MSIRKLAIYYAAWFPNLLALSFFVPGVVEAILSPPFFYVLIAMQVVFVIGYILLLVDIWRNENIDDPKRVVWFLVCLFLAVPGLLIYFLAILMKDARRHQATNSCKTDDTDPDF